MINFAIRYQPIIQLLQELQPEHVLEVGSGPEGLAMFWPGSVTGVDLAFKRHPLPRPVCASALTLPFAAQSWPTVLSCDMLEHIPPASRLTAVEALLRVTKDTLLLAFPSGPAAQQCYRDLAGRLSPTLPDWLAEHVTYGLPDADEVAGWLHARGWSIKVHWHESVAAHYRLMRLETLRPVQAITYGLMRLGGPWAARYWPVSNASPCLRALIVAQRN